jgi:phosphate transport system ATP-binding protein
MKITVNGLRAAFGDHEVVKGIDLAIPSRQITAIIGPSGCGKSTFLRCLNRMHELVPGASRAGQVLLDDTDIYADDVDPVLVRRWVGMVFQKPNPFPSMSIKDNVVAGLRLTHRYDRKDAPGVIERALRQAALWDEVKDKLNEPGTSLSGGQQQRLCIARALAVNPDVILLDEPCSALDPIATARIEELLLEIRRDYTMVIVTHNMGQAQRVAEHTAFFLQGELVEFDTTAALFGQPARSPHRRLHRRPVRVRSRAARRPVRDRRAGCRQGRRAAANPSTISPMRHLRAGLASPSACSPSPRSPAPSRPTRTRPAAAPSTSRTRSSAPTAPSRHRPTTPRRPTTRRAPTRPSRPATPATTRASSSRATTASSPSR